MMSYNEKKALLEGVRHAVREEMAEVIRAEVVTAIRQEVERMMPDVLSIDKVAEEYGISKNSLYKVWPEIGGMKAGGKIFFSRRALDATIKEGKFRNINQMQKQTI